MRFYLLLRIEVRFIHFSPDERERFIPSFLPSFLPFCADLFFFLTDARKFMQEWAGLCRRYGR